jgi:hypothetical protein
MDFLGDLASNIGLCSIICAAFAVATTAVLIAVSVSQRIMNICRLSKSLEFADLEQTYSSDMLYP